MEKVTDVDVTSLSDEELDKLLESVDDADDSDHGEHPAQPDVEETPEPQVPEVVAKEPETAQKPEPVPEVPEPSRIETPEKTPYDLLLEKVALLESRLPPNTVTPEKPIVVPPPVKVDPEEFFSTPEKVMDSLEENRKMREYAVQEKQLREFNKLTEQTKSAILKVEPTFEQYIPEMAEYLKTQGVNEGLVDAFKQNPYAAQNVPVLKTMCDLAKITKANKERSNNKPAITAPQQREISVARPGTVKAPPAGSKIHTADISRLSDAELDHIIEKGHLK